MLCSICKKNTAIVFTNKIVDGKSELEGLCFNCAKEKGINPLEVLVKQSGLSEKDLNDMNSQLENMFNEMSENIDMDELSNGDSPLSMFSNLFGGNNENTENMNTTENESSVFSNKKRVKTEKKHSKKKKY